MQQVHDEVRRNIAANNDIYKQHANARGRFVEFAESDMVMVRICPDWLPPRANKRLHPRNAGPFKIVKKISSNAYVLELPVELGISSTFNVEDLTLYRGHHIDEGLEEHILSQPPNPPPADQIVDVLDDQLVSTRREGFQNFLVRWKDRPILDASWIIATDFQCINSILYKRYQAIHSPESSFSKARKTDAPLGLTQPIGSAHKS